MAALRTAPRNSKRFDLFSTTPPAAFVIPLGQPPRPRKWARLKEVAMFQMIDQTAAESADRKTLLYKIGMFIMALAAVGGVVFLCVRSLI
jgi:hypothetical protein